MGDGGEGNVKRGCRYKQQGSKVIKPKRERERQVACSERGGGRGAGDLGKAAEMR